MTFKELYTAWDLEFTKQFNEYLALCRKLDTYAGRDFTRDLVEKEIHPLLDAIDKQWAEIYPSLHCITSRYADCLTTINHRKNFIADLEARDIANDDNIGAIS